MTGQQLKNSILQEAIQGRLVSNVLEPGEKTGVELLQDILAERQKKENEEKGKKAKRLFLSAVEEEPWDLPESWCWTHISDVFDHSAGKSLNSSKLSVGKVYPYLTTSNVYWEGINFEKVKEMTFSEEEYKKCSAIKNDILVCEGGDVGRSCIWTYDYSIGLQNHVHRLRAIKNTDVRFFNYVLRFYKATGIITAKGIGIGGFSANALKGLTIPLPPLSIQKAIVAKIEELFPIVDVYDKARGELENLNKTLPEKLRKSVLQEAIHGTLVSNDIPDGEATAAELLQQILKERQEKENKDKGKKAKKLTLSTIEEEPWELPEGWCWCSIGDICDIINGFTPLRSNPEFWNNPTIPWFTVDDIREQGRIITKTKQAISDRALAKDSSRVLPANTILLCCTASLGEYALTQIELTTNQQFNGLILPGFLRGTILPRYLFSIMPHYKDVLNDICGKTTFGFVSVAKVSKMLLPLPPLSIQHRIVEKIEEVFASIDKLQA